MIWCIHIVLDLYWWPVRIFYFIFSTGHFLWGWGAPPHSVPNHHWGGSTGLHSSGWKKQKQEIPGGSPSLCEEVEHLQGAGHCAAGQPAGDSRQVRRKLDNWEKSIQLMMNFLLLFFIIVQYFPSVWSESNIKYRHTRSSSSSSRSRRSSRRH